MENKILLLFIFGLTLASTNVNKIEKQLVSVLSHYDLGSSSNMKNGKSLTFIHKGSGAEHMIDIDITEDNEKSSLLFHNAKFDDLKKTFKLYDDLFTAQSPAYVELVYRMARTRSEEGKVYFTTLDDLFAEISNISNSYTTSKLPPKDGKFNFVVQSNNSNVMLVTAKINKVESENKNIVEENFQVDLEMNFSNNNQSEEKKHSFLMFGKKDFSFLKQILEKEKVENSYDVIKALQDAYKGNSKVTFGETFTNEYNDVLTILFFIKVPLLVEVSQVKGSNEAIGLSQFTVKLGRVAGTFESEKKAKLSVEHPLYKIEDFLRCDSKFIKDSVAGWDLSKASESFDHIILTVYRALHKEHYEETFKGASLVELKEEEGGSGNFFKTFANGLGLSKSIPIINAQTNYEGKPFAKFTATVKETQVVLSFKNVRLGDEYKVDFPVTMITAELARNYLEPAFVATKNKILKQNGIKNI